MRAALELLYRASGLLAGFFLVAIGALTAAQIAGRGLGFAAYSFDDFAGFCMAASSFLGLAFTFRENEHIRMTLVLHHARGALRRALELACLAIAAGLVGLFAWYACDMTFTSYDLHDVSQGLVAVPLWIPQSGIALGLVVLWIGVVDDLVATLRGAPTSYEAAEARKPAAGAPAFER
jgi:TRAP-type C4-dicarboxylate transport system permease small subunit